MFFRKQVHPKEVIRWGVFDGVLLTVYIVFVSWVYSQQQAIFSVQSRSEWVPVIFFVGMLTISGLITLVIALSRPIYALLHKNYRDAALTLIVSIIVVALFLGLILVV